MRNVSGSAKRSRPVERRLWIHQVVIGVDEGSFWSQMQGSVDFQHDVLNGVIKSFVFGLAVTAIALFEGYDAPPTAEGVKLAAIWFWSTSNPRELCSCSTWAEMSSWSPNSLS